MSGKLERKYGLFTAICMVVGIVIGSGVFFKAQTIMEKTGGDMPMGILAWLIGGAIMLVCLLTFSFMGQKYERVNGLVDYAEATVGPRYGYAMGWFSTVIYFPAMTSVLAWVSARYTLVFITEAFPNFPMTIPAAEGGCIIGPECMALTLVYLCGIYGMNALAPKLAGKFQTSTTVIKMIPLALMAVGGVTAGLISGMLGTNLTTAAELTEEMCQQVSDAPLFAAVCATAFAYEGWIIATSINAEIKNSKKNLPRALIIGGLVIVATYLFYYIGAAGGATNQQLLENQTTFAFKEIFGPGISNILNLFIAISCLGTTNGLMLGCTRCMYALAERGEGPAPELFSQVDKKTNMPNNSAIFALIVTAVWFLYFYASNLAGTVGGLLPESFQNYEILKTFMIFDSSELPIITIYLMYLPILIRWMIREKDQGVLRRFVLPLLALCGSVFMVVACILSHKWGCFWYLIVFMIVMGIGLLLNKGRKSQK